MTDLRQHQLMAFESLKQLDQIFKEAKIPYYLIAGTALGALREGGFIPWDDDIDIAIAYEDMDRAEQALMKGITAPFTYISVNTDPHFPRLHPKILHEGRNCIDVFPLVRVPDSQFLCKIQWLIRKVTWKLYSRKIGYLHEKENKLFVAISRPLAAMFSAKTILKIADWNCRRYAGKKTQRFINMYSVYSMEKEMIRCEYVEHPGVISFEGQEFPTLGNLDGYLTHLYGSDYMTPRPPKDGVTGHEELF